MEQELEALLYVRANSTVSAPQARRTYRRPEGLFIEMDFVRGSRLDRAWPDMCESTKNSVMDILAGYLWQFRGMEQPGDLDVATASVTGGPFKDGRISARSNMPIKQIYDLHLLLRRNVPLEESKAVYGDAVYRSHSKNHHIAFTHADISPRNIILDHTGKPVLIDWEFAGWYPEYWEYTKIYFAMWESVPGWLELVDEKFPIYSLELKGERLLWG